MNRKDALLTFKKHGINLFKNISDIEIQHQENQSSLVFLLGDSDIFQRITIEVEYGKKVHIKTYFQIGSHLCTKLLDKTDSLKDMHTNAIPYKAILTYGGDDDAYNDILSTTINDSALSIEFITQWFSRLKEFVTNKWTSIHAEYNSLEKIYTLLSSNKEARILLCEGQGWRNFMLYILHQFMKTKERHILIDAEHQLRRTTDIHFRLWDTSKVYRFTNQYAASELKRVLSATDIELESKKIENERRKKYNLDANKFIERVVQIKDLILDNVSSDNSTQNNYEIAKRKVPYNGETIEFIQLHYPFTKEILSNMTSEQQRLINVSVEYFEGRRYSYDQWQLALSSCKNYLLLYYHYEIQMNAWDFIPKNMYEIIYE